MKLFIPTARHRQHYLLLISVVAITVPYIANAQSALSQRSGYNLAKEKWDSKKYDCNLPGVLLFWKDIKEETFKVCDKTHFLNQQRIESCKEGAATYVREKANSCASESDCQNLGTIAADMVAQEFCFLIDEEDLMMPSEFFPPACQPTANRYCNIEGQLDISSFAKSGNCGSVTLPLTEAQNLALQSECREFVRDWSRQSLLP
jgi:hypothetical protein